MSLFFLKKNLRDPRYNFCWKKNSFWRMEERAKRIFSVMSEASLKPSKFSCHSPGFSPLFLQRKVGCSKLIVNRKKKEMNCSASSEMVSRSGSFCLQMNHSVRSSKEYPQTMNFRLQVSLNVSTWNFNLIACVTPNIFNFLVIRLNKQLQENEKSGIWTRRIIISSGGFSHKIVKISQFYSLA